MTALSGEAIRGLCGNSSARLIKPVDDKLFRGAKYDLRAGKKVVEARPQREGGIVAHSLDVEKVFILLPGTKAIIYSYEDIQLPADLRGELNIRSEFYRRGAYAVTGPIDPGYYGKLFIHLINNGDSPITITYLQPLASVGFMKLDQPTQFLYKNGEYQEDIDVESLLPLPEYRVKDLTKLAADIDRVEGAIRAAEASSRLAEWLTTAVLLAAVAGLATGAVQSTLGVVPTDYKQGAAIIAYFLPMLLLFVSIFRNRRTR